MIINPIKSSNYAMPTQVYFGRNFIQRLPQIVSEKGLDNILLCTGEHVKNSTEIRSVISKLKYVKIYSDPIKKCDFATVNKLTTFCRREKIKAIIAIGGGNILDTLKCVAILSIHEGIIEDYVETKKKKFEKNGLFLIAMPTTSGTGSDVSPWAVIWEKGKKYALSFEDYLFPKIAIVDPSLTDNCPSSVTATAGIDAMCQAIEAYWNVNHNPVSDKYALDSIKFILGNLDFAVNHPNKKVRDNMAWGSLVGGLAFSNTATTICHSVSYPITSHWGIAHGQATSITLPSFIEYTFPAIEEKRLNKILRAMNVKNEKEAAENIRKLIKSIGLKTHLSELGISKSGIDIIVAEGFDPERAKNSPRIPTAAELRNLLVSIY